MQLFQECSSCRKGLDARHCCGLQRLSKAYTSTRDECDGDLPAALPMLATLQGHLQELHALLWLQAVNIYTKPVR